MRTPATRRLGGLAFAAALAGCAPATAPGTASNARTYANPVLNLDFADPAVLRAADGFYYAYATQTEKDGKPLNIQVARSRDLVAWDHLGDALPVKPRWGSKEFWAPHVARHGGTYYLYYSARPDQPQPGTEHGLCLAVATATRPEGPFTDKGAPLQCGESFSNIDPMSFDDPATGKRLLYWGSAHKPIKVQELGPDRLSFKANSRAIDLIPAGEQEPKGYQRLIEGAWVIHRPPYYYMFYSGNNCCGENANYAVMVARSRSATGPFETLAAATGAPTSVILEKAGIWLAPGHNSIIRDAKGDDWIVYHAIDTRRPRTKETDPVNSRRIMLIDRIVWKDGWPRVEGPSTGPRPAPSPRR